MIASDETSARVEGKTWWQWVLMNTTAISYAIVDTRAASVITDFLDGVRPEVWVAGRYAGQAGHAQCRQMCLAHLLRDAQSVIATGRVNGKSGLQAIADALSPKSQTVNA